MNSLSDSAVPGNSSVEETSPKKVRFRDKEVEKSNDMVIELSSDQYTSWRDMLVGE
ncbi:hypothetical protein PVK06_048952 [Gossypium arboreum]|uniref:Uncharacterized protein n=1 Tax=Gossypium arboreum TaxID=29729 RepID=A0ABR0MHE3_GOSAR|nr:hypothetical protein PVK06_048952 [Gossypium arboreum]